MTLGSLWKKKGKRNMYSQDQAKHRTPSSHLRSQLVFFISFPVFIIATSCGLRFVICVQWLIRLKLSNRRLGLQLTKSSFDPYTPPLSPSVSIKGISHNDERTSLGRILIPVKLNRSVVNVFSSVAYNPL